jgi:DNA polymerase III delta subunit
MPHSITIRFKSGQAEACTLIHRLRNYGEDVFRFLRDDHNEWGELDLSEVDAATEQFTVHGVKRSKLRRLLRWIEDEAERQNLCIDTDVS